MARPGVEVVSRATPPSRGAPSETGVWFVAGLTQKGPASRPVMVRNIGDYIRVFGGRVSYGQLYDALDAFFREGGSQAYVSRVVGPDATNDTATLSDASAAPSIAVSSIGPGANLAVSVVAGIETGTFRLIVAEDGANVESSYDLSDPTEAVSWGQSSEYVRVQALGGTNPTPQDDVPIAGGTDDRAGITDAERTAALAVFTRDLGPGQISFPGATTQTMHSALLDHAKASNRFALLDGANTSDRLTLESAADSIRANVGLDEDSVTYGAMFAPWALIPGVVRGTMRTVPPSGLVAGLIARSDSATGNPNQPAAGRNGESNFALGLSQPGWSDSDRESLNENGVNVLRSMYGGVRLYGYRTLADLEDPAWLTISAARTRMAIVNDLNILGEQFMFAQLDGKGKKIAEFAGAITGVLQGYWNLGALYGETADEAFVVDTGPTVNTPESLANNELHAIVGIRTSPFAELVYIEIVKVPVTEAL